MTHDDDLLRADEQARRDALDVSRSFIVQAPAGSGKTELLIQRYLHLLATVDNPEEVLAITFTRKAAAEMQLRVLQALQRSQRGDTDLQPHEQITAAAAARVLSRDSEREWQMVRNPRRMRIQTLDSLNASIAQMQPLTGTGTAAGNAVVEDAEMQRLYRAAAAATLDWLPESGPVCDSVRSLLRHVDNDTGLYVRYLERMLATRDQWLTFVGAGGVEDAQALRIGLERNLDNVVARHLEFTRSLLAGVVTHELLLLAAYAGRNAAETAADHPLAVLADIDELPNVDSGSLAKWCSVAELLLTQKGGWRKQVNKNQGFPPGDSGQKQSFVALLDSLAAHDDLLRALNTVRVLPPTRYSDEQWSVLLALFELLPMAVAELRQLFSANGVTDYIEIALSADLAVGTATEPGDIALLLDYQVRHVLVDEMQDTSLAQYRMLEALTGGWEEGDGRTLFCVGDPMQSIYRFRNAEVAQFLIARDTGIGTTRLEPLVLRRNFRSAGFLVDWFNTVFPIVLPIVDNPSRGAVSYVEAVAAHRDGGECRVYPLYGADAEAEAALGCKIIADTLNGNPADNLAVLVRSRTHLSALLPRLRDAGIAYQAIDIDRLTDLPEIIDVLALTRAVVHTGDRLAWLGLLRSPWIGLDWTDLHRLVRNDARSTVWELLNTSQRLQALSKPGCRALQAALPVLKSILQASRSEPLRQRIERGWLQLGGPALLRADHEIENVYRFLDVLEKLETAGSLQDTAELERQLDLERISSVDDARLQIMTMHRAKGLQFDHVLLYGLGRVPRHSDRDVLGWYDLPGEHGRAQRIISPVGARADTDNDPIHRFIGHMDAQKDHFEIGRLLYVACTRACKSLHLVGHTGVASDGESMRAPDARSLLHLLWPSLAPQYAGAFDPARVPAAGSGDGRWLLPELQRLQPDWRLPGVGDVPGQDPLAVGPDDSEAVEFYWVGSEARIAGTVVHRWLQLATDGRARLAPDSLPALRVTSDRWLREAGVGQESSPAILARIERALQGVCEDAQGEWLLSGQGYAELPLTGLVEGRVESAVIDRVRVDDDGTHWIVDYKTSTHEGGDLAGFLDAEADRYRGQLQRYAALYREYAGCNVRCALYFPLLQAFVEVAL